MNKYLKYKVFIFYIINTLFIYDIKAKSEEPWRYEILKGNLLLSTALRPAPLFSFGQKNADENDILIFEAGKLTYGKNKYYVNSIPQMLYGITDRTSLYITASQALYQKENQYKSIGMNDLLIEAEHTQFFRFINRRSQFRLTIVINTQLPTGSAEKNPKTGFGGIAYFFGFTAAYLSIDWYAYTSHGANITTKYNGLNRSGNQFLYQAGLGHNLGYSRYWIFCLIIEANGIYSWSNIVNGHKDKNSGSNIFYIGPSVWITNKHLLLQSGFQFKTTEQLFGNQINKPKTIFLFETNIGWKF